MVRKYFKIAFRNLKRRRGYTLLNVLGLAVSIACVTLIFSIVRYHLSFDSFHSKKERIYRVTTAFHREGDTQYMVGVPQPLGDALRRDFEFAEKVANVATLPACIVSIPSAKDIKFEEDVAFAEPAFFSIMDFPVVRGNPQSTLNERNTAVVTARIARKYFGDSDPIGKVLRIDNKLDVLVAGILQDLPKNTDRKEEIYLPFGSLKDHTPWMVQEGWPAITNNMQCFVLLKRGVSPDAVNRSLADLPKKYYDKDEAKVYQFSVQTLSDIHFNSNLDGYISKQNLWVLSLIGIFLIITACVNFTNLATAQALGRTREIGVRKALGSMRGQIFWQFMTETILVVLLAIVLSIVLTCLSLPYVSRLFDLHFSIISIFNDPRVWAFLALLLLIVTFISGAYPSVIVAGFQPVPALKGKVNESRMRGLSFRKGLVVVQFAISQLLIVSILVIARQMHYAQQEPGFDKEAVVMVALPNSEHSKRDLLTTKFSQIPGIETISFCNEAPVQSRNYFYTGIRFEGSSKDENFPVSFKAGDPQYASVFGLQLLEGRNLFPSDTVREFLLNETAVKKLGIDSYEDAIGKRVDIYGIGTIVGVVKDFHNLSFRQSIDPLCITTASDRYASCAIRINPHNLTSTLRIVENVWQETFPDQIYHMTFLDEQVAHFYKTESILFNLIESFAGITIVIACLGLYGLVSFLVTQKTKEVGVRKIMGASAFRILWLFAKEFINLLIVAFAIAAPIAWWTMTKWLGTFVYRVDIGAWVFVLSIGVTFLLALISVGYQSLKAALANPVHSLRNELHYH